jgi:dienelactone hydrolase
LAGAALVVALGATACSSAATERATSAAVLPAESPTTRPRLQPGHTEWTVTFVDSSRKTVPASGPVLPTRTLRTAIYRPNGTGPFPLIVFAHGLSGHPDKFTKLFSVWADAGFAVAAPAFPLTNDHVADSDANVGDVEQQPADMSFVLDRVLALARQPKGRLAGAIDEMRIGAGGLSLGGFTVYDLAFGDCCRDRRIKAVEVLDGFRPGDVAPDGHVPLLIAHSDTDPAIPYSSARDSFRAAHAPAWFVTLLHASHASQWENTVTPYDHVDERLTTDFWEATLGGDGSAFARLERDASVRGLASITEKRT